MFIVAKTNKAKQIAGILDTSDSTEDVASYAFLHKLNFNIIGVTSTNIERKTLVEVQQIMNTEQVMLHGGGKFTIANRCLSQAVIADDVTAVTIPVGVSTINGNVFHRKKNLRSVTFSKDVRKIGSDAFSGTGIENLVLPEGVEVIGDRAFRSCIDLKSVSLPSTLKRIGYAAFSECKNLKHIQLPEGLEEIDGSAFSNSGIIDISIPDSLLYLGENVFYGCKMRNLEKYKGICYCDGYAIALDKGNEQGWGKSAWDCVKWSSIEFKPNIRGFCASLFEYCPATKVIIPDTVRVLPENLFGYSDLREIVLSDSLKVIGDSCFKSCKLKHIEIPDSVEVIGKGAFLGCRALTDIKLSKNLQVLSSKVFQSCIKLTHITLPEGLKQIEPMTFAMCKQLTQIDFPTTLRKVGTDFLYKCLSIERVELPEGVEEIKLMPIQGCVSLKEVVIPSTVKKLGQLLVSECPELKRITIKAKDVVIGDWYSAKGQDLFYLVNSCSTMPQVFIPRGAGYKDKLYYAVECPYTFSKKFKEKIQRLVPKFL